MKNDDKWISVCILMYIYRHIYVRMMRERHGTSRRIGLLKFK